MRSDVSRTFHGRDLFVRRGALAVVSPQGALAATHPDALVRLDPPKPAFLGRADRRDDALTSTASATPHPTSHATMPSGPAWFRAPARARARRERHYAVRWRDACGRAPGGRIL
jgi:hypothetical protein